MAYPQSIAPYPHLLFLNTSFSTLRPQISLIQPPLSILNYSSSILRQKNGIFHSKSPQNSVISDNMSASAACTAYIFFQVYWKHPPKMKLKLRLSLSMLPGQLSSDMFFPWPDLSLTLSKKKNAINIFIYTIKTPYTNVLTYQRGNTCQFFRAKGSK